MKDITLVHVKEGGKTTSREINPIAIMGAANALVRIRTEGSACFNDPDAAARRITEITGVKCEVFTPYPELPLARRVRIAVAKDNGGRG